MSRTRLIGIGVCLTLLFLMTQFRPQIEGLLSTDTAVGTFITYNLLGLPLVGFGLWGVIAAFKSMFQALTLQTETCTTCKGTGAGRHYVRIERMGPNGHMIQEEVLVNHCGPCKGNGWVYKSSLQMAAFGFLIAFLPTMIGVVLIGSSLKSSPAVAPVVAQPAVVTPPVSDKHGDSAAPQVAAAAIDPSEKRIDPMGAAAAIDPPSPPVAPRELVLKGEEIETNGHVWELEARLQIQGQGVHGPLTFKLTKAPPSSTLQARVNTSATMQMEGIIRGSRLILRGTSVSDPAFLAPSNYEVTIDPAAQTFFGMLPSGQAQLRGRIQGWPDSPR